MFTVKFSIVVACHTASTTENSRQTNSSERDSFGRSDLSRPHFRAVLSTNLRTSTERLEFCTRDHRQFLRVQPSGRGHQIDADKSFFSRLR